jgi:hypothetical protein
MWGMGMQEKYLYTVRNGNAGKIFIYCEEWECRKNIFHELTYVVQRKIMWNDAGRAVTQHITIFSFSYLTISKCRILKYLCVHL